MTSSVRMFPARGGFAVAGLLLGLASLSGCGGGSGSAAVPGGGGGGGGGGATISLRAVHGSPDLGPVDVYIYSASSTQPSTPTIANFTYPAISAYLSEPVGTYKVNVYKAGTSSSPTATYTINSTANETATVVVAGQVGNGTLQVQSFIEPAETAGQSALLVHHASPAVNAAANPVGVAVYPNTDVPPVNGITIQAFTFALATPTGGFAASGPAASGAVAGGEFYLSPLPAGLPSDLGFAAGGPASIVDGQLTSIAAYATLSGLAAGLTNPTTSEAALAADSTNAVPSGAHLSVFAVDSITSPPGILIGTLDP